MLSNNVIRKSMVNLLTTRRKRLNNPFYCVRFPEYLEIKLTNKCNLRCKHCYQWSETGHNHLLENNIKSAEMSLELFEKILNESQPYKSRIYLWGGEPFLHSGIREILKMLKEKDREVIFETNAMLLNNYLPILNEELKGIEFVVSFEGFEAQNDFIRGKGVFLETLKNIQPLIAKKEHTKHKITIHIVINNENCHDLYDMTVYFNDLGVDNIMFVFPNHITDANANLMDKFYDNKLEWLNRNDKKTENSWHSFKYCLESKFAQVVEEQICAIRTRKWNCSIRFEPFVKLSEMNDLINNNLDFLFTDRMCLSYSLSMHINADGSVLSCKLFDELKMGNLHYNTIEEIWHNDDYKRFRAVLNNNIMPVCKNCCEFHLHAL